MSNRLFKLLLVTLVVPVVGFFVASLVLAHWQSLADRPGFPTLSYVCGHGSEFEGEEVVCGPYGRVSLVRAAAIISGIIPVVLIVAQVGLAAWAGRRRDAMAVAFPLLMRLTIIGLVVMVVLQALVAIAVLWYGESELIGRVHMGIIATLGIGALIGAQALVKAVVAAGRRPSIWANGRILSPEEAPGLFAHVRALANRLNSQAPQNIIVGLDPTFYVTSAEVRIYGQPDRLSGETLYLSANLARLLTSDELDAVIGHELGHFRGADTAYSLKFAPVYAGVGRAIVGLIDGDGKVSWAAYPALQMLAFLHDTFAGAESEVGRSRELEADRVGAEAASPDALARALLKVTLFGPLWEQAMQDPHFVHDPVVRTNLAAGLALRAAEPGRESRQALDEALQQVIPHPVDTHPPLPMRLEALGVDPAAIDLETLKPPGGNGAAAIIDGLAALEEQLSAMELEDRMGALPPRPGPDGEPSFIPV